MALSWHLNQVKNKKWTISNCFSETCTRSVCTPLTKRFYVQTNLLKREKKVRNCLRYLRTLRSPILGGCIGLVSGWVVWKDGDSTCQMFCEKILEVIWASCCLPDTITINIRFWYQLVHFQWIFPIAFHSSARY